MTLSLLFDLDDTLISTNMDAFLKSYFKKFAVYMASSLPPEKFMQGMMHATQIMYASKRMDRTLEQVFFENFYPALGMKPAELEIPLGKFYEEVYPSLAEITSPRPEAIRMVEWAFSKGWNVAIATDPLFPRAANLERLRWAGLDPEKYPFKLISDFQSFHFAKASLAFYPEFLARMGWSDGPVLMVGDSLERDILPARQTGLPSFWLTTQQTGSPDGVPQGTFEDLKSYLENTKLSTLKVNYSSPQALIPFLMATPAAIHTLMLTHAPETWSLRPQPAEWSLGEIVCHLRDVNTEVNLSRVETILREDNASIPGVDTDHWAEERQYARQDPAAALNDFVAGRSRLINLLAGLSPQEWDRRSRHTFLGPTSLHELVEFMVDHDRLHIRQAAEALNEHLIEPCI